MKNNTIQKLFSSNQFYSVKNGFLWKVNFGYKEFVSFITDLEFQFIQNSTQHFDFGTFIFEKKRNRLEILDGNQRFISISILVSTIL